MRVLSLAVGLCACSGDRAGPEGPLAEPDAAGPVSEQAPADASVVGLVDSTDVVMGLVGAPGRDTVLANCVACHSTALITQNHMSRAGWDATVTWMQETQGLWEIPASDRATILDYLALTQGVEGAGQGAARSPWAAPLYRPNPLW